MAEESVVERVHEYLAKVVHAGIPASSAVIFGSFARGESNPESDIDLLVLSPAFDNEKDDRDIGTLWRLTRHVDIRIEPHAVGVREFAERQDSPIIAIARHEGIVVQAPGATATVATA